MAKPRPDTSLQDIRGNCCDDRLAAQHVQRFVHPDGVIEHVERQATLARNTVVFAGKMLASWPKTRELYGAFNAKDGVAVRPQARRHVLCETAVGAACACCLKRFHCRDSRAARGPCGGPASAFLRLLADRLGHELYAVGYDSGFRSAASAAAPDEEEMAAHIVFCFACGRYAERSAQLLYAACPRQTTSREAKRVLGRLTGMPARHPNAKVRERLGRPWKIAEWAPLRAAVELAEGARIERGGSAHGGAEAAASSEPSRVDCGFDEP